MALIVSQLWDLITDRVALRIGSIVSNLRCIASERVAQSMSGRLGYQIKVGKERRDAS
jgi:hypothetical protein